MVQRAPRPVSQQASPSVARGLKCHSFRDLRFRTCTELRAIINSQRAPRTPSTNVKETQTKHCSSSARLLNGCLRTSRAPRPGPGDTNVAESILKGEVTEDEADRQRWRWKEKASSLKLTAENPGARDWSLGDTVRLSYVLETQADTHVACTRDSRLVSAYLFSVPTHSIPVRVRRLLLVRNASVENAGRYLCRARSGNVSRAVGWRVRVRAHDKCPPAGAKPCHEVQARPCTPCSCPQGRAFFGKSRAFTCHDAPRGPSGADLKMALNVSRKPYSFEQFEPVVLDYELRTYGDTQITWLVDNVLYHTHTVLVPPKSKGLVVFRKRFFMDPPPKVDRPVELTVEAQLRHTDMRTSESLSVLVSRSVLWSSCREQNCSSINAHCAPSGRCECAEGWAESRGVCRLHCHSNDDCGQLGKWSVCKDHECECGRGHVLKHKSCIPLECVSHKMCTDAHGAASSCHEGHCWCLAGHVMTNGTCEPVDCLDDSECSEENTRCVGRRCRCASDFDLVENKCRKSKRGVMIPGGERCCMEWKRSTAFVRKAIRGLAPSDLPKLPVTAQGLWGVTKLVTYCLGLVVSVVASAAVSVMLLRAKASAGHVTSPDETDESYRFGDEGAIMAETMMMRNRHGRSLDTTQEPKTSDSGDARGDVLDDVYGDREERRSDHFFVRSLFPKLSDALMLASYAGSHTSRSSDSVVSAPTNSRRTVDI